MPDTRDQEPGISVAPSPHVFSMEMTVPVMMRDVIIGLIPAAGTAIYFFRWYAVRQLGICIFFCLAAEALFTRMRRRPLTLGDLSAVVTGVILALSLPATAAWYVGAIGSAVAMGIGKIVFGGLGMNIFNPAMVGRAFVMIAFAGSMAASGYIAGGTGIDALSQATPLSAFKQFGSIVPLRALLWGTTNGSLGETSAAACLAGGLYLCLRRVAAWQIPAGILAAVAVIGGVVNLADLHSPWTMFHHLLGGALLFGAFFIATDPVTSPVTPRGKWIFGIGLGALVMLLRLFSGYPEGVMFAVLLMNALTPLINRWTVPRPFGGV